MNQQYRKKVTTPHGSFLQFSPFLFFLIIYVILMIYTNFWPHHMPTHSINAVKNGLPIFAAFMAIIYAMFTFSKKTALHTKIEVFLSGSSHVTILYMYYIFIVSTALSHILHRSGGINSAVTISLALLSPAYILPGIFTIVSIFSLATGSSLGSITAFMPVAYGISQTLGIDSAVMAATVVSSAFLGDNLSMISDTTIASCKATGAKIQEKFKENIPLSLFAFVGTIIYLLVYHSGANITFSTASVTMQDFINVIPYVFILSLSLLGCDVLALLTGGTLLSMSIGIMQQKFTFLEATSFIFEGFYGQKAMVKILIMFMFISGLAKIIKHNGGMQYLLNKMKSKAKNYKHAQFLISGLIIIVNATIAINTLSILICGPLAKKIAERFYIPPGRIACILDVAATGTQCYLPYAPAMLLASSLSKVSIFNIMRYLVYQPLLLIALIGSIFFMQFPRKRKRFRKIKK